MRYLFFLYCLLSIGTLKTHAYPIEKLGLEHGLSNNYIRGITQDKQGFMWFATESGLNRFDGREFRVYKKNISEEKNNTISGNELNKVYADRFDNIIWIATQREGLNAFDCETETFTHYTYDYNDPHSLVTNDITNITNSKDSNLWISTYHGGFDYFDKKTGKFTHYNQSTLPELISNHVWSIAEDKNGILYIGHVNAGLSIFSPAEKKIKNFRHIPGDPESLPGNGINIVFIDNRENIWIGTDNGLALFNPLSETFVAFKHNPLNNKSLISNFICTITQMEDGSLWIGTENGGISVLNIQHNLFLSLQYIRFSNITPGDDSHSLSNQTVWSIYQDIFKNIWIGTYGGGINFIPHRKSFFQTRSYSPIAGIKNGLSNKIAWGICADKEDNLWIGTDGSGIDVFEKGIKVKNYNKDNSALSDNAVIAAFKDSKQNLWFGTFYGGIHVYNHENKKLIALPIPNTADIRCFSEDREGNVWIGSANGIIVYHLDKGVIKTYTKENSPLRDNLVRSIWHDQEGNSWIGSFGEGLGFYNSDMEVIKYFYIRNELPSNMINHILGDKEGNVWVATGEGLLRFTAGKEKSNPIIFNEKNGLDDSHVRALTEDTEGNIWLSTTEGISVYVSKEDTFYNYNHYDGVPLGDFMSGSVTQTSDGQIYFGSQNGVCYFDPQSRPAKIMLPPVVLTNFRIIDTDPKLSEKKINIPLNVPIRLDYNQNTFEVSFNVLDYSLNRLVEYGYMLKGLKEGWYNNQSSNTITFRNIPPGSYELLIRAKVRNQEWSDDITSLRIHISPPFWLSWWAKTIYILLALILIIGAIKFYKRKLDLENSLLWEKRNSRQEQELNNERLRFFTNITHELRTPLTLILGPLEDLTTDKSLSNKHASKIEVIYKSANRLLKLINQILEFRKTETQNKKLTVRKDNPEKLIREIGLKYKELNTKEDLSFECIIEKGNYEIYYDPDIVTTILENLISNAFKYTDKGNITLRLSNIYEGDTLYTQLEVKDTGRGIHPDSVSKIFDRYYQEKTGFHGSGTGIGLALVQNLVTLHQGSIHVESEVGKGTVFRFRLKNDNKYEDAIHALPGKSGTEEPEEIENENFDRMEETKQIILVIEDNKEINRYIADSLSELYRVHSAYDGKDGVEKAYTLIPDIIISDIMMPEVDGFELTGILKGDVRTSHIPIILLTAKDTIRDRTEGYSLGADSYITKPFSANLLKSRITNLLDSRRKLAEQFGHKTEDKTGFMLESLNKLDKEFIRKVTLIIEEELESDDLGVNLIAEKMAISHSTLYRKIKALTEMTINEFIRKIRIRKAEQLLLTGQHTISEITYMIGMNSMSYFRNCFKEEFGCTPSDYIKNIKERKGQPSDEK